MSILAPQARIRYWISILVEVTQLCGVCIKFQFWTNLEFGLHWGWYNCYFEIS